MVLINRLEIRNMRKVKQAEIDFHGPGVQVIEGINQSGKTTVGQAIAITMNGPKNFTPGMITRGEEEAEIIAYTNDELKIRTIMGASVKQSVGRYDEGLRRHVNVSGGVRAFLDSICSGLEQPWALSDIPDVDIVEILMGRSGATEKIDAIDSTLAERQQLRTETGRDRKRLGESSAPPEDVKHPGPIDEIKKERQRTRSFQLAQNDVLTAAADTIKKAIGNAYNLEELESVIPLMQKEIAAARGSLNAYKDYMEKDAGVMKQLVAALDKQIADWYEIEEKAKAYDAYLEKKNRCDELDQQYEALTAEIEDLRAQRKKVISDINLGVKGLEISEDNLLVHNGIVRGVTKTERAGNWSTAESVQVFFGLAARFAGKMKVLVVDNAESLDTKTTGAITAWAEKAGFLVIMLRVAEVPEEFEDGVIYIREGEIVTKEAGKA